MREFGLAAGVALLGFAATVAHADVVISTSTTQNVSCSGGVCTPTSADAVLNVVDLEQLLGSGNVEVTTTGSGVQAKDIVIRGALAWASESGLTLDAYRSVGIGRAVSISGAAELNLDTNDGGRGGSLTFGTKGQIAFSNLSSQLSINGSVYTLVGDLETLANDIAGDPAGNFALAAPYNARKHGAWISSPIPTAFSGIFDGLGNKIRGMTIHARYPDNDVALFATLAGGALNHVRLVSVDIIASGAPDGPFINVAALAGTAQGGTLSEDSATGTISGNDKYHQEIYTAGLVGTNYATIRSSVADVKISMTNVGIGGLVGDNWGTITDSQAKGAISGGGFTLLGGLTAYNARSGIIKLSSSSATVTFAGKNPNAQNGGLVGENQGVINQCFATGNVSGGYVGALVGVYAGSIIKNSYSTGSATGDKAARAAGGLIGGAQSGGEIENVYSTGAVSSQDKNTYRGGLVGDDFDTQQVFTDSYWDTDTSGISNLSQGAGTPPNDPGITGLTSQELQSGLPAGFSAKIWAENPSINNGFPYLIANRPR